MKILKIYKIFTIAGLLGGAALVLSLALDNTLDTDQITLPTQKITPDKPAIIATIQRPILESEPELEPEIKLVSKPKKQIASIQVINMSPKEHIVVELSRNLKTLSVVERKQQFFDLIIPLILQANQEIMKDRKKLIALRSQDIISIEDQAWLSKMYTHYRVQGENIDLLLQHIDAVPVSLAASQAAIESAWGTSRFAQEGNALFGQHSTSSNGMKPLNGKGFTVAKFDSILDSVRGYMLNLNTHRAYRQFRKERAHMRYHNQELDAIALAKTLVKYSERGLRYIHDVVSVIRANNLS